MRCPSPALRGPRTGDQGRDLPNYHPADQDPFCGPSAPLHETKSKARAETKARNRCPEHPGQYNQYNWMPLSFAALEHLIGVRDEHGQRREAEHAS